jgi:cytochrome c6
VVEEPVKKIVTAIVFAIVFSILAFIRPAIADESSEMLRTGAKVFSTNCAACHINGGNAVMANKNLKKEALSQFGMDSEEAIIKQVTYGKNAMPAFKGRLTTEQIQAVASYVLAQSEKDWKK